MRWRNWIRPVLIIVCLTLFMVPAESKEKFYPFSKIKAGMNGEGLTVFYGDKIEKFRIKVISVLNDSPTREPMLLVRLSGSVIEQAGGLAAGMSGSPIYIGGRLAGAISYGFENADPFLALVTPIESMNQLLPAADKVSVIFGRLRPIPVSTPVMVSGMGRRGMDLVDGAMRSFGIKAVLASDFASNIPMGSPGPLSPGSAVGIQLVSGDYAVTAIGTTTMVDGSKFLAFGHPFTNRGNVDFQAVQAYIHQTVKSSVMSYKLGSPRNKPIGRVIQDRFAGVAGKLGEKPELIDVQVQIKDMDRNLEKVSKFQVAAHEALYRDLILAGILDGIDRTIDRVGQGTGKVKIRIETANLTEPIEMENFHFNKDIAAGCLHDLRALLDIASLNELVMIKIKSIGVEIEIEEKPRTARILDIKCAQTKVRPGEKVKVTAVLHTFRGDYLNVPMDLTIPTDAPTGQLTLHLYGGAEPDENDEDCPPWQTLKETRFVSNLFTRYLEKPRHHQLILSYAPEREKKPTETRTDMQFWVQGKVQLDLTVN